MIGNWWDAHELEYFVAGVVAFPFLVFLTIESVGRLRAERRKKRKDGLL